MFVVFNTFVVLIESSSALRVLTIRESLAHFIKHTMILGHTNSISEFYLGWICEMRRSILLDSFLNESAFERIS